jgi:hypothetical protein
LLEKKYHHCIVTETPYVYQALTSFLIIYFLQDILCQKPTTETVLFSARQVEVTVVFYKIVEAPNCSTTCLTFGSED